MKRQKKISWRPSITWSEFGKESLQAFFRFRLISIGTGLGQQVQSNLSLRTPLYYGQFVWSQRCQKSYIPYHYNTDMSVKRTIDSVPLVSVLRRFDCNLSNYFLTVFTLATPGKKSVSKEISGSVRRPVWLVISKRLGVKEYSQCDYAVISWINEEGKERI